MSITVSTDDLRQTTYIVASGILTLDQIKQTIGDFYRQEPTLHVVWDLSGVTRTDLTFEQVQAIAKQLKEQRTGREGGKTALVSPADVTYGLGRMLEMMLDDDSNDPDDPEVSMMVFRDLQTAHEWLGQGAPAASTKTG